MSSSIYSPIPSALFDLKERIDYWRTTRAKKGAMPIELWQESVVLAKKHGISLVCKTLSLSYSDLKKKVKGNIVVSASKDKDSVPLFVDIGEASYPKSVDGSDLPELDLFRSDGSRILIRNVSEAWLSQTIEHFLISER